MLNYVVAHLAVASALVLSAADAARAAPAALSSGLRELSVAYDRGDAPLPGKLAMHLHDGAGNPVVRVHLEPDAAADVVLTKLAASGFRVVARDNPIATFQPIGDFVHEYAGTVPPCALSIRHA